MPSLPEVSPIALPEDVVRDFPDVFTSPEVGRRFENPWPHAALPGLKGLVKWKTSPNPARKGYVKKPLPVPPHALADFEALGDARTRLFWIGHASFLVAMDGVRIAIDPIFGRAGGLVPRVTPPAAQPSELTGLDAVLVTHGHHDHLDPGDLGAIARANDGKTLFVVPRGLGKALPAACTRVVELSWWESVVVNGVRVVLVPAQHWHRRGLFDTGRGLWGGFVVEGSHRVYHSGDTGFFSGFEAIGRVFGGVDVACLPLGAFEPDWFMSPQHMDPQGSLDAFAALRATHFVGMHWAAYDLSDELLDGGPRYVEAKLARGELDRARVHVLAPGGSLGLDGDRGATRAIVRHDFLAS